jgi:hypothetical protein
LNRTGAWVLDGKEVTALLTYIINVVIDSFRDTSDRNVQATFHAPFVNAKGPSVGTVSSNHVQLTDIPLLEKVNDHIQVKATTGASQNGSSFVMNVLDQFRSQDNRLHARILAVKAVVST